MRPSSDIFSPYYPISSFEPVDCVWVLSVYDGNIIAIGFNEFDLEISDDCASEYVELRDGESDDSPLLGRYCESAPMVVIGSKSKMRMRYYSVGTGRKGFEATWTTMVQTMKKMKPHGGDVGDVQIIEPLPHPPSKFHLCLKKDQYLIASYNVRKLSGKQTSRVKKLVK